MCAPAKDGADYHAFCAIIAPYGIETMSDYHAVERTLQQALRLERRPVAITFCDSPPPGVDKFTGVEPSSCSFWRLASSGRAFYTVAADHYNCPVGAYTHNVPLPAER